MMCKKSSEFRETEDKKSVHGKLEKILILILFKIIPGKRLMPNLFIC